jgi:hypothetical protein
MRSCDCILNPVDIISLCPCKEEIQHTTLVVGISEYEEEILKKSSVELLEECIRYCGISLCKVIDHFV